MVWATQLLLSDPHAALKLVFMCPEYGPHLTGFVVLLTLTDTYHPCLVSGVKTTFLLEEK